MIKLFKEDGKKEIDIIQINSASIQKQDRFHRSVKCFIITFGVVRTHLGHFFLQALA